MRPLPLLAAAIGIGGLTGAPGAAGEEPPLWLLTGTEALVPVAEPLAHHRRTGGYQVVVSPGDVAAAIGACPRRPDFLLIVGDDPAPGEGGDARWRAPSGQGEMYRWRSVQKEAFATDSLLADTDADGVPEFPVGRIPARTAAEVEVAVRKTIAYESRKLSPADLGLPIWGGTPAYGKLLDEGATTMLLSTVRKRAPAWAEPWVMFGNPRSPLSAHPPAQPSIFNDRLREGALLATMMGHGDTDHFHSQEGVGYHRHHTADLNRGAPAPPLVIFACDCGRFNDTEQSLAEALLFAPAGPVNVVAATTESHPLTNYYSSLALLAGLGSGADRFGDLWHRAQLDAYGMRHRLAETLLKNAEGALEAKIDIPKLKRDQLLMYALLGDPATRIPNPRPLSVELSREGDSWTWSAARPAADAELHVAIRRPSTPPHSKPEDIGRDRAMRLFEERNAAWKFEPVGAAWEGTVRGPGVLRLVAVAGDQIYAFARDLAE